MRRHGRRAFLLIPVHPDEVLLVFLSKPSRACAVFKYGLWVLWGKEKKSLSAVVCLLILLLILLLVLISFLTFDCSCAFSLNYLSSFGFPDAFVGSSPHRQQPAGRATFVRVIN